MNKNNFSHNVLLIEYFSSDQVRHKFGICFETTLKYRIQFHNPLNGVMYKEIKYKTQSTGNSIQQAVSNCMVYLLNGKFESRDCNIFNIDKQCIESSNIDYVDYTSFNDPYFSVFKDAFLSANLKEVSGIYLSNLHAA